MFVKLAVLVGLLTVAVAFSARTSNGAAREQTYVVRAGDSLWSIATAHYGGDVRAAVWRLQERNRIAGALVRPGQQLVLP
jgi:nucleoid-associated protein YgaU